MEKRGQSAFFLFCDGGDADRADRNQTSTLKTRGQVGWSNPKEPGKRSARKKSRRWPAARECPGWTTPPRPTKCYMPCTSVSGRALSQKIEKK